MSSPFFLIIFSRYIIILKIVTLFYSKCVRIYWIMAVCIAAL